MNMSPRYWVFLVVATVLAFAPFEETAAQYECCPTTSVVAYQPVATSVVTPVDPGLINGWYPGKLLDRWAANRAAYRGTALTTATTAYRPLMASVPATSYYRPLTSYYRPLTSAYSTSYMPVSVYRPIYAQSTVATTAYSPIVPSSAVCCDPCSTGAVASYPTATSACCGTSYGGVVTSQPTLGPEVPTPGESFYRSDPATGGTNNAPSDREDTVLDPQEQQQQNGGTSGTQQNEDQQQGAGSKGTSFEGPSLQVPNSSEDEESLNRTARNRGTEAVAALYSGSVRPELVRESRRTMPSNQSSRGLPSRAERDAGWRAVSD